MIVVGLIKIERCRIIDWVKKQSGESPVSIAIPQIGFKRVSYCIGDGFHETSLL